MLAGHRRLGEDVGFIQGFLAGSLLVAGLAKVASPKRLTSFFLAAGASLNGARPLVAGVALIEIVTGFLLFASPSPAGALLSTALFVIFSYFYRASGEAPCGCFGALSPSSGRTTAVGLMLRIAGAVASASLLLIGEGTGEPDLLVGIVVGGLAPVAISLYRRATDHSSRKTDAATSAKNKETRSQFPLLTDLIGRRRFLRAAALLASGLFVGFEVRWPSKAHACHIACVCACPNQPDDEGSVDPIVITDGVCPPGCVLLFCFTSPLECGERYLSCEACCIQTQIFVNRVLCGAECLVCYGACQIGLHCAQTEYDCWPPCVD